DALAKLAVKYGGDAWFRKAIMSSDLGASYALYKRLTQTADYQSAMADQPKFMEELSFTIGASGDLTQYKTFIAALPKGETDYELGIIKGFAGGIRKAKPSDATKNVLVSTLSTAALDTKGQEIVNKLTDELTKSK